MFEVWKCLQKSKHPPLPSQSFRPEYDHVVKILIGQILLPLPGRKVCTRGNIRCIGRPTIIVTTPSHVSTKKLPVILEGDLQFGIGFIDPTEGTQGAGPFERSTRFLGEVCVRAAGAGVGLEGVVEERPMVGAKFSGVRTKTLMRWVKWQKEA